MIQRVARTVLSGKNALVTGGGRGMGRGITLKFLEAGARVLVAQRQDPATDLLASHGLLVCPLTWSRHIRLATWPVPQPRYWIHPVGGR